nr:hypothetical protein [Amycolatopsis coloradensis]
MDWFLFSVVGEMIKAEAPAIDKGAYPGDVGSRKMNPTALKHIIGTSDERNVDTEIPARNKKLAEQAVAAGYGKNSYSSVIEALKKGGA